MAEKSYSASHNFFSDKDPDCCPKARWNPPGFGPLKSDWTKRYCFYLPDHPGNGIALLIFSTVAY